MTLVLRSPGVVLRRAASLALALGLLGGCASPDWAKLGTSRADVLASLGTPVSGTPLSGGGERLLYTTQPSGFSVFHLDFDAQGRLVRREQVLTQERLAAIPLGQWTVADVQRTFGPPMRVEQVARFEGDIWTYRFRQLSDPRLAHVHLDRQGTVRQVLFTDELPLFDNARD